MDSWYLILGYLHLHKVGTKRHVFFNKFECHGNLHCQKMKNDHSLFGYIDIDGIIYEISLIPANHCHVLSVCMSIIVALRLFIVHMNWQPVQAVLERSDLFLLVSQSHSCVLCSIIRQSGNMHIEPLGLYREAPPERGTFFHASGI